MRTYLQPILGFVVFMMMAVTMAAQQPIQLAQLVIQLWPEYDRVETLVIYRGQLADAVPLPATITLNFPARVRELFAAAVFDEQNNLVNAAYDTAVIGDQLQVTLTLNRPAFQLEYYDPAILTKNDTQRTLQYTATLNYPAVIVQLEVQQPLGAESIQFTPPVDETAPGSNQFTYHIVRRENLAAGDTVSIIGNYRKQNDTLTADFQTELPQISSPSTAPSEPQNWALLGGYVLVGAGVIALLSAGLLWVVKNNRTGKSVKERSPNHPNLTPNPLPPPSPVFESRFCPKCGASYKDQARFCHQCGTPRR